MSNFHSTVTCKDFLPNCLHPGGLLSKPIYENFSAVVNHANDWLQANRKWKVKSCESVEFKYKGEDMDCNKMTYLEYGQFTTIFIRGLRNMLVYLNKSANREEFEKLWLTELEVESDNPQKISYLNLFPKQVGGDGIFAPLSFETLDDVINGFHYMIQLNPLPGRIITVESQALKLKETLSENDPDRSYWKKLGIRTKKFLFIIRIYYELTATNPEEIELKDFIPDKVIRGNIFLKPQYEAFSKLVEKAGNWFSQQVGIRLCNIQSLDIKKKSGEKINTRKMEYTEHGDRQTSYVRILRIAYVKSPTNQNIHYIPMNIGRLVCKTFVPEKIGSGLFSIKYENLSMMKEKISAWIKHHGVCVLGTETSALRIGLRGNERYRTEDTYTYNTAERNEYWIFIIRLYLNV